jgi:hypothetical protein
MQSVLGYEVPSGSVDEFHGSVFREDMRAIESDQGHAAGFVLNVHGCVILSGNGCCEGRIE